MLIPTAQNTKTITDMREDAIGLLRDVQKLGLVYLFQHSDPRAVVLSLDEFERLQDLVEDYLDTLEAEELAKRPRGKGIPLEKVLARYKKRPGV